MVRTNLQMEPLQINSKSTKVNHVKSLAKTHSPSASNKTYKMYLPTDQCLVVTPHLPEIHMIMESVKLIWFSWFPSRMNFWWLEVRNKLLDLWKFLFKLAVNLLRLDVFSIVLPFQFCMHYVLGF